MRVVGLLSWFDEDPQMLYDAVKSHAQVCDMIVALDGRYRLFDHPQTRSGEAEYVAIREACRDTGMGLVLREPDGPWDGPWGGEVAKRAHLFDLAMQVTDDSDWLWVFDGDVVLEHATDDWREQLAATDRLVAEVELDDDGRRRVNHATVFKALRGLTVTEHHWHYHVPGGPVLWDYEALAVPRLDLSELVLIRHRDSEREALRKKRRAGYYRLRDRKGVEHGVDDRRRDELDRLAAQRQANLLALLTDVAGRAGAVEV